MNSLIHCIYASSAVRKLPEEEIQQLLGRTRTRNAGEKISGMLLYTDNSFIQVLEGEPPAVDAAFERISRDPRHSDVTVIIREPIARRAFVHWSMGYTSVSREAVGEILGRNDFFDAGNCFATLDNGRAKKLLRAFGQGRWRQQSDVMPELKSA